MATRPVSTYAPVQMQQHVKPHVSLSGDQMATSRPLARILFRLASPISGSRTPEPRRNQGPISRLAMRGARRGEAAIIAAVQLAANLSGSSAISGNEK